MSTAADNASKVADALAAASITTWFGITLSDLNQMVSICAGIVAIIAGLAAAYYHITRARRLK